MSINFTAADVLTEVAGMVKQDRIRVKAGHHVSATITWKDAEAYVCLWPMEDNVFNMWYIPRKCSAEHLSRHDYYVGGDSAQQVATKVFATMQDDLNVCA
ncbi:hypothetical protein [Bifidobacterium moukalabense]|uniref:hypothetical protein n=1 Tax=Bifidobacterium moukalabense TaxID=1333651 RepID=UPI0010F6F569|nr:hypothetical protein [Bifidobacterium moukalabense]